MTSSRRIFLWQAGLLVVGSAMPSLAVPAALEIKASLPRSDPESQGISSSAILQFIGEAEKQQAGLHSFMIVRHGHVVAEGWWFPYAPGISHQLYSLSKNIASTAIGFAIQENILRLDDKVISFFPELENVITDKRTAAITIRDLLIMASGHGEDTLRLLLGHPEGNWAKAFLAAPLTYEPGTRFVYNSGCTYMLSAILQRRTGITMAEYLQPRFFKPLGITDVVWDTDPQGINVGAVGLWLKTEDIARFGQFYLQKGSWNGKQLLSGQWIEEATSFKIRNDDTGTPTKKEDDDIKQGYGYQFWMSRPVANGAYRAEGAFCQYSIVMPEEDAVVAITAEGISTKRVMDLVWYKLLPAMKAHSLPPDKPAHRMLKEKLGSLQLAPPAFAHQNMVSAGINRKYRLAENSRGFTEVSLSAAGEKLLFTIKKEKQVFKITCGLKDWHIGKTSLPGSPPHPLAPIKLPKSTWKIAAFGSWKDDKTFVMTWRFFETAHYDIVTCRFHNDDIRIEFANSVTRILKQYPDPRPALIGTMV